MIWEGQTAADTKVPEVVAGYRAELVLRAPVDGGVKSARAIGDIVTRGDLIATVGDAEVRAPFSGVLRGLIHDGLVVEKGLKIGDLDPREAMKFHNTVSDKALAIGGGCWKPFWLTPRRARRYRRQRR